MQLIRPMRESGWSPGTNLLVGDTRKADIAGSAVAIPSEGTTDFELGTPAPMREPQED